MGDCFSQVPVDSFKKAVGITSTQQVEDKLLKAAKQTATQTVQKQLNGGNPKKTAKPAASKGKSKEPQTLLDTVISAGQKQVSKKIDQGIEKVKAGKSKGKTKAATGKSKAKSTSKSTSGGISYSSTTVTTSSSSSSSMGYSSSTSTRSTSYDSDEYEEGYEAPTMNAEITATATTVDENGNVVTTTYHADSMGGDVSISAVATADEEGDEETGLLANEEEQEAMDEPEAGYEEEGDI
ncbi:uncharacterized protein MONOS_10922 [Monocercomonoides exilis]|uniref:uncharacterized protein n=1 Tax=Monocercomonoides exilis TaxID=2049356 RepID=UPI003559B760|nr:hypothetical protein MONOS_10922 [Monocercomonoides exilis]|eukprot:MONOS_10922.1-p1 / transcript=MONOS_10922.1 / gene=MONOS_10922 / organism=Monocercomonoides_exilis_PA203 / gene_product=unspecified product / transcript_product=unspecified product / location=Mono_scaffold00518:39302-40015(+) / protein_length=238 / sequence_SO=supercontig / SO=protein_coding / is_pseudo=false